MPTFIPKQSVESQFEQFCSLLNLHYRLLPLYGNKAVLGIEVKQHMQIWIVLLFVVRIVLSDFLCLVGFYKKASHVPEVLFQAIAMTAQFLLSAFLLHAYNFQSVLLALVRHKILKRLGTLLCRHRFLSPFAKTLKIIIVYDIFCSHTILLHIYA